MSIIASLYGVSDLKNKYNINSSLYPAHDLVPPEEKENYDYCVSVAQDGFARLMKHRNSLPAYSYSDIQMLRDYGTGTQSEEIYINRFKEIIPNGDSVINPQGVDTEGRGDRKSTRTGLKHINTKIISPIRNIKDAVHGMFDGYEEDVFADAIDADSGAEAEKAMNEAFVEARFRVDFKAMEEKYGIPITTDTSLPSDVSPEELLMYKDSGGFKTKWSEGMEQLVKYTEKISEWSSDIKRKFIDDYFDLGFIAARCVFNYETNQEEWEYIDVSNFTIQYSTDRSFKDAEYAGYFTLEKMSKLVQMGYSAEKLVDAAKTYEGVFNNPRPRQWSGSDYRSILEDNYYDYSIPVFHYYWIEADVYRKLEVVNEYGKKAIIDINHKKAIKPLSDQRKEKGVKQREYETRVRNTYQASWIVGTDMCYDFGRVPNQPKEKNKTPKIPIKAYRNVTTNPNVVFGSKLESIIPFLDGIQEAWLKHQDAVAKSHPGGYAINIRLLENLELGKKSIEPIDAFKMFWETGRFPYRDYPLAESYKGGAIDPLKPIPGNLGELTAQTITLMETYKNEIYDIVGLSPAVLGVQTGGATATETQIRTSGSHNTLKPLLTGIFYIKEKLAEYTANRIQLLIRNVSGSYEAYSKVAGKDVTEVIKRAENNGAEYGIFMEARPSAEEINDILQAAQAAMSMGRDGASQIEIPEFLFIKEQLMAGGNIKKLRRDLSFMVRRKKEEDQAIVERNITLQNQQQATIEQQKAQAEQQAKQIEIEGDILLDDNKAKNEIDVEKAKSDIRIKEELVKAKLPEYASESSPST